MQKEEGMGQDPLLTWGHTWHLGMLRGAGVMESGRTKLLGLKKPIQYYDISLYLEMKKKKKKPIGFVM